MQYAAADGYKRAGELCGGERAARVASKEYRCLTRALSDAGGKKCTCSVAMLERHTERGQPGRSKHAGYKGDAS